MASMCVHTPTGTDTRILYVHMDVRTHKELCMTVILSLEGHIWCGQEKLIQCHLLYKFIIYLFTGLTILYFSDHKIYFMCYNVCGSKTEKYQYSCLQF